MSATAGETPLLVTRSAASGVAAVEWRTPDVELTTVARGLGPLPATGWQQRFTHANGELVLPPAYRLLAAIGPDATPDAWLERWHLLDLFVVLIATAACWRLLGWRPAMLVLVALALTHHEPGAPSWLWLNVLVALALLRAAPEGRLGRLASAYHALALVVVAALLIPFVVTQLRLAVFPQLEASAAAEPDAYRERGARTSALDARLAGHAAPAEAPTASALPPSPAAFAPPPVATPELPAVAGRAPLAALRASSGRVAEHKDVEQIVGTGARRAADYEPGTLTQSGPGLPRWRHHQYRFSWSGPVEASEKIRFVISPPWLTRLWRLTGAALSLLLLWSLGARARPAFARVRGLWRSTAAAVIVAVAALCATPGDSHAAATPDPSILAELRKRLLAPPRCAPECADVLSASVEAGGTRLSIVLSASALDLVGLALPSGDPNWSPDRVEIDGAAAGGIYRDTDGGRYVPLARGRHMVRIEGPIADVDALAISFPARPHRIDVTASGWEVGGVAERRLLSGALELSRQRSPAGAAGSRAPQSEFPPFVTVVRDFRLGHDWTVDTTVDRIAPASGAFTVRIPLLPDEQPLTPDLVVSGGVVSVGFTADDRDRSFRSALPQAATFELKTGHGPEFSEIWRFDVAPSWRVEFSGVPAVQPEPDSSRRWRFEYVPRAGERLVVRVTRPAAVGGATLAFDGIDLSDTIGARSRETRLQLEYRSTQGGRQTVSIPPEARVTSVRSDGEIIALRPEQGTLSLPVLPGSHRVVLDWQTSEGISVVARSSPVAVSAPASNLSVHLHVPENRWVLFATGAGIGPAVLYWGELLVFLAVAFVAGRSRLTPLSSREWLLLGLGLSTFSWLALALFAAFVAVFEWRGHRSWATVERSRFNALQVGLAVLAVAALLLLVDAVPQGLLAKPDMRIAGGYGRGSDFRWFIDQTAAQVPAVRVISVSLWWYKLAMLAWALWLSFAMTRWVRWAWNIFRTDGLWRSRFHAPNPAQPPAAGADQ